MKIPSLYFRNEQYYCAEDGIICSICKNKFELQTVGIFHTSYYKNEYIINIYCQSCLSKFKKKRRIKSNIEEFKSVLFTLNIPKDAVIIFPFKPELSTAREINTVEAAYQCRTDHVIDNTKYANRLEYTWQGAAIEYGNKESRLLDMKKDLPIEPKKVRALLEGRK